MNRALLILSLILALPVFANGNAVHEKMRSMDINAVELQITPGQDHGFFNKDPFQTATLIAADRFFTRLGLLSGQPTLKFNPLIQ